MYQYIGIAVLSIAAIMLLPVQSQVDETSGLFWGLAHVVVFDSNGNEVMSQTVHNILVDEGETFIVNQVFKDGALAEITDTDLIGSICLSDSTSFNASEVPGESLSAATFDSGISFSPGLNDATVCIDDDDVDTATQGLPKIGALTFTYGTNTPSSGSFTISLIGICQGEGVAASASFGDCEASQGTGGKLFAAINITDFTLANAGETAQIDYTFDIRTTGT